MDEWWKAVPDLMQGGWCILAGSEEALVEVADNGHCDGMSIIQVGCGFDEVRARFVAATHNAVVSGVLKPDLEDEWTNA